MLLDDVFDKISRTKKVWIRKDGELKKLTKELQTKSDAHMQSKPMFPIKSPRYE